MFGVSFTEALVIGLVTLVVVGPQKLPKMMRTIGEWVSKLRRMTTDMRAQTGIDDVLRSEGIHGGLTELRSMLRGDFPIARVNSDEPPAHDARRDPVRDPYANAGSGDRWREYPPEGPDAYGALPDDLSDPLEPLAAAPSGPPIAEELPPAGDSVPRA